MSETTSKLIDPSTPSAADECAGGLAALATHRPYFLTRPPTREEAEQMSKTAAARAAQAALTIRDTFGASNLYPTADALAALTGQFYAQERMMEASAFHARMLDEEAAKDKATAGG